MSNESHPNQNKNKIIVWGDPTCGACTTANDYFKTRSDIDYTFNSLTQKRNRDMLSKITQNPSLPPETPVIQRCYTDAKGNFKCDIATGFSKKKYEPRN